MGSQVPALDRRVVGVRGGRWGAVGRQGQWLVMTLTELVPEAVGPDALYDAFASWVGEQGISLYPAQEEALIEVMTGSNVILSTPTGSGKSRVATGSHFAALANGKRTFYTAPIKA